MRLIDADALIEKHREVCSYSMKFNLDLAPTVKAVSREEFKAAVNELCRLCGRYTHEHDGACNGCKWRERRG